MTEADEMYQNAGEKGVKHADPEDPPRRRANKVKGHGTWDNDRPPVAGVVGRESGEIRLEVCHHSDRETLQPFVEERTPDTATVYTDDWQAYNHLPESGRVHASVCHTPGQREWARDDDPAPAVGAGVGMVCGKYTAIPWKAFGPAFGTSCDSFEA